MTGFLELMNVNVINEQRFQVFLKNLGEIYGCFNSICGGHEYFYLYVHE